MVFLACRSVDVGLQNLEHLGQANAAIGRPRHNFVTGVSLLRPLRLGGLNFVLKRRRAVRTGVRQKAKAIAPVPERAGVIAYHERTQ